MENVTMENDNIVDKWHLHTKAAPEALQKAADELNVKFPTDYLDFMKSHNGGEGFVGSNYLIIWQCEELAQFNAEYEVNQYVPGLIFFGSSGGGEAYAFDARNSSMAIVRVPFIGMSLKVVRPVADSFSDLWVELKK